MRLLLFLLLAGTATPALAQQAGTSTFSPPSAPVARCTPEHAAMGHCTMPAEVKPTSPASTSTCTAEHASMGHCKLPAQAKPTSPAPTTTCTPEHATMGHCTMPAAAKPTRPAGTATCTPEHAAMGHCALSSAGASQADPHAGHGASSAAPPVAPPPPEALSGPAHAADRVFGATTMTASREDLRREHGDMRATKLLIDRLEWRAASGRDGYLLDGQAWYGGDINKLWVKTEVEVERGRKPEQAEVQGLWSRAIDPWFDLQTGIRFDANRGPDRTHLVLGVQGLAPYWYEVDGAVFLSNKGELTARAEAEYDLRITQKLILQPLVEVDLSAQDIEELGIGSGLSTAELGLRLRYQVSQQFSPYFGLFYERAFGDTRRFRRAEGDDDASLGLVAGLRLWF